MQTVKRIELVVPDHALRQVLAVLDQQQVRGYTVARGLGGAGDRGRQSGDGMMGEFDNASVLVACAPAAAEALLEALRPLLATWGGMCLVSEAQWLMH